MKQRELEHYAVTMYERVNDLWSRRGNEIFDGACGFSVLSGPPIYRPKLMIIGENPGFGADDHEPHVERRWPEQSHITDASWILARKLRAIFDTGRHRNLLNTAIQTNFQFFKSSYIDKPSRFRWNSLPSLLRSELKIFCLHELTGYVRISEPKLILVLGLDVFDRHASEARPIMRDRSGKRRLLVEGRIFSVPAIGILHPSGAQVANEDWTRVASYIDTLATE